MELAHGAERRVIEVLAIHERAYQLEQLLVAFARNRARLDPGIALPLAPLGDEVGLEKIEVAGERSGVAVRAQAHVDAEREAILGDAAEHPDQPAAGMLAALLLVEAAGMHEHEVDVRGNVELASAQLAHGDDDQLVLLQRCSDAELRERAHGAA